MMHPVLHKEHNYVRLSLQGVCSPNESVSVEARDSLAELRGHVHDGSLTFSLPGHKPWMRAVTMQECASDGQADFASPATNKTSDSNHYRPSSSSVMSPPRLETTPAGGRDSRKSCRSKADAELGEEERRRWMAFRQRKKSSRLVGHRPGRKKAAKSQPIVLSSEEDEHGEGGESSQMAKTPDQIPGAHPSFLELDFLLLHAGLSHADANGKMMITSSGIHLPLKGEEEGEVTVVASQVRGYGLWSGAIARGGTLLDELDGQAPSLFFLWVTDAQANMLQREMAIIHNTTVTGPACSFLLLVMTEQLPDLKAALLVSMLEMMEFRESRSTSAGQLTSPLDWSDGQLLLHSCPPPLDEHLFGLLGQSPFVLVLQVVSSAGISSNTKQSSVLQVASRLIQYPPAPSKGRITVTKEDLACLEKGHFLNDIIIDFYLKYLLVEGGGRAVAERSHIFSSFFFRQLSRQQVCGQSLTDATDPYSRHQRVKTWTRHVDVFSKDFLFVPINQEAHWFLAVVCFPGQDGVRYEQQKNASKLLSRTSEQQPACTQQGCMREVVLARPCILVMDSLKMQQHERVCKLLRDYLQVEWEERREQRRVFCSDSMRSCSCNVPRQDNSSDCGLYLLQYVESFLQNPVVHFDLPPCLLNWFPRQRARQKRDDIRHLIMRLHANQ
ncbi:sentrin-specific protease 7-like isoform X4 [Dunckerocampus dactyliophorus]|uniref:sentrin-specific protease 7-like isoform X4 n=1 Tax=Dunckerocampus dactyliophorus TaxID=161453 RepID=UPI0024073C65|nr:sentrin-specific protease 7-like isoform X4 [Dunckerocampus dactyliophorus]